VIAALEKGNRLAEQSFLPLGEGGRKRGVPPARQRFRQRADELFGTETGEPGNRQNSVRKGTRTIRFRP
jgi:hypothetical protein